MANGDSVSNGTPLAVAGVGVRFHPTSPFNISEPLPLSDSEVATSRKADGH